MDLALLFIVTFGLIALELPVAFALIAGSLFYFLTSSPLPPGIVVQRMAPGIDSFPLLAIPLFVLAGNILNSGGIAARIFEFATALVGHIRGGLAHVNVVASLIFAGMSGVAQADAAGLGTVEIRAMRREGFDPAFAAAVSASSAIVGPIIPPSVIMVVYGVLAQVSVGDLFLAGIIPGFVIGILLMITIVVLVEMKRVHAPVRARSTLPGLARAFIRAIAPLLAPVLLCAGLLLGVATPTELGALTVVYATGLGFLYRDLTVAKLLRCLSETLVTSGVLIFIMSLGGLLNGVIQPSRDMMVRAVTPPGAFGKVFGFVSTGFNIGGMIAPLLYGSLMDRGEPRLMFVFVAGFIVLALFTVITRPVPLSAPQPRPAE